MLILRSQKFRVALATLAVLTPVHTSLQCLQGRYLDTVLPCFRVTQVQLAVMELLVPLVRRGPLEIPGPPDQLGTLEPLEPGEREGCREAQALMVVTEARELVDLQVRERPICQVHAGRAHPYTLLIAYYTQALT